MVRNTKILLTALLILTVALTGCLKNPVTGRIGPSWDVPVQVPLIAGEVTVGELAEEYLSDYLPEDYDEDEPLVMQFSDSVQVEVREVAEAGELLPTEFEVEVEVGQDEFVDDVGSITLDLPEIAVELDDMTLYDEEIEIPAIAPWEVFEDIVLPFERIELTEGNLVIELEYVGTESLSLESMAVDGISDAAWELLTLLPEQPDEKAVSLSGPIEGPLTLSIIGGEDSPAGSLIITVKLRDLVATHVEGLETEEPIGFEFDVSLSGLAFDSVTFDAGTLEVEPYLTVQGEVSLTGVLVDADDILGVDGLAGITLENGMTITIQGEIEPEQGLISTLPENERQVNVTLVDYVVKAVTSQGAFDSITITQAMDELAEDNGFISLTIEEGELRFTFEGLTQGALQVTDVEIVGSSGSEALTVIDDNVFDLAGVVLSAEDEISVTVDVEGDTLEFDGDTVTATVSFEGIVLSEATVLIDPQSIDVEDLEIEPVEFDLGLGDISGLFDWLSGIGLKMQVILKNPSGIPLDLSSLELTVIGADSQEYTVTLSNPETDPDGITTTYTAEAEDWLAILGSEPQQLALAGSIEVASDPEEPIAIDLDEVIEVTVEVEISSTFTIDYDQEFEDLVLGKQEVAQQADLEKGLEFIAKPALFAEVTNGIPLGVEAWLDLSTDPDEDNWDDAYTIELGLIPAAATNDAGRAVEAKTALFELDVDEDVQDFLKQGGKMRVRVALAKEGRTGEMPISIAPADKFQYRIWADMLIKVNQ
jgi:hypothetical protein